MAGMAAILTMTPLTAAAQGSVSQTNPSTTYIIQKENAKIDTEISKQAGEQGGTAILEGSMSGEFWKMKQWQDKYNSYLKTVQGFASSMQAGSSIYAQGVEILQRMYDLQRAVRQNPQGVGATLALNKLYLDVAVEFIDVYTTLKESVAKGTEKNMLSGSARTEMLWDISDQLSDLNKKLRQLTISIAFHNLTDVWNTYTAGIIRCNKEEIASDAYERWARAAEVARQINQ